MRTLLALALLLSLSACCCGKKTENFVADAPTTLRAAKALAQPPHVTVEVQRITRHAGGGGSCHSAVCVLLLPILLYEAVFPEKYDVVTIQKDGVETFSGNYTTGGDLLTGVVRLDDGTQKEVRVMSLDALGKNTIVEAARTTPSGPDGGFVRVPTLLQSQHDFLADYRAALKGTTDEARRGALLTEAFTWLDDEASPLLTLALKDPAEPDAAKAQVMTAVCKVRAPQEQAFVAALGDTPGPFTALALLACEQTRGRRPALLATALTGGCALAQDDAFERFDRALNEALRADETLKPSAPTCARADRAALFALRFGGPVDPQGLTALLKGPHALLGLNLVDLKIPERRAPFFAGLGTGQTTEQFLKRIPENDTLSPAELAELARAYTTDRFFASRDRERARVLSELARRSKGVDTGPARAVLTAHRDTLGKGDQPVFEVALLVLGDRTRLAAALKGAGAPYREGLTSSPLDLVNYGLELAGCTSAEVKQYATTPSRGLTCAAWAKR